MPTGYTAEVADGKVTDFRTFALRCARAFGAAIMQRDDPMNEPPKLREVSDYTLKYVAERQAKLAALDTMTVEQANDAAALAYGEALKEYHASVQRETDTRNRYNAMLAEAVAWEPPTPEHAKLKEFMIQQLTEGRKFDCGYEPTKPVRLSGPMWLAKEKADAARMLGYAHESLEKETASVEQANQWITALYESLAVEIPEARR
jgi:hypothetical protein